MQRLGAIQTLKPRKARTNTRSDSLLREGNLSMYSINKIVSTKVKHNFIVINSLPGRKPSEQGQQWLAELAYSTL
jgi:hypothetical protein